MSKIIVAKGFKKFPKVQKIAKFGHTGHSARVRMRERIGECAFECEDDYMFEMRRCHWVKKV